MGAHQEGNPGDGAAQPLPTVKRRPKKPQARYLKIERAIIDIARRDQPVSLRHIYYALIAAKVLTKSKSNANTVSDIATKARRAGLLPWSWIVDNMRESGCVPWGSLPPPSV